MSSAVPEPLEQYVSERRRLIEAALEHYLPPTPPCPPVVRTAMQYSLVAGGKRLRPILTLAAAEATSSGDGWRVALPAACAIEWIHTYSLIHDDLPAMDNDTLRRGRPTSHVVFGEGLAILAGDGLLTEAFALLAREPHGDDPTLAARKLEAIRIAAEAAGASGMVGGQALDLEASGQCLVASEPPGDLPSSPGRARSLDAHELQAMHARKTGALIRAAVVIGATMAGASQSQLAAVSAYGAAVGLAFQIVDDILDVEGEAGTLGKTAGKDAALGKSTYPALHGVAESRRLAAQALARALSALDAAGVGGRLADIARWVVARVN